MRFSGAVFHARLRRAQPGSSFVILQWARIVTESQLGSATEKTRAGRARYQENIAREPAKSDAHPALCVIGLTPVLPRRTGLRTGLGDVAHTSRPPLPAPGSRVQARQASRPSVIRSCGRSTPMKTILLVFFSIGSHLPARSLPIIWCTPWNTTLRSTPFI